MVLCSTDGWLEAGDSGGHVESDRLIARVEELCGLPLEQLIEGLREDVLARSGGALRDDHLWTFGS